MRILLEDVYKKVINFLNREKLEYLVIGGVAAGTLGEPRVTGDIDRRKRKIRLYNIQAFFPTPEDFILLKIIPCRTQDLLDAQRVVIRHKGRLDISYLRNWARRLSDEAQDMRIFNELKKLLKENY